MFHDLFSAGEKSLDVKFLSLSNLPVREASSEWRKRRQKYSTLVVYTIMILNWIYNLLWHVSVQINFSAREARSSMMHSIQDFCVSYFMLVADVLFFGFIDSHSHSVQHHLDALFICLHVASAWVSVEHQILERRFKNVVGKIHELEVFSYVSW